MSDVYSTLQVSPRKKRCPPALDDNALTPKKLRTIPPTPPPTTSRGTHQVSNADLPIHLTRLYSLHTALQHAMSHALATCAISPTSDSGIVRNVLNHISLTTYTGVSASFEIDDLKRLCWIWEWDVEKPPKLQKKTQLDDEDDNPFVDTPKSPAASSAGEWTRGSMGFILSPATHFQKRDRKRVPAYGIGIDVEMDIDKDMGGGMAAVARWTAAADTRRSEFRNKLEHWIECHYTEDPIPSVPMADLPPLAMPTKISSLTRTLALCSPKSGASSSTLLKPPSSPFSKSPNSPTKMLREFSIPFPVGLSSSPTKKNTLLFPQTPSRRDRTDSNALLTPKTPSAKTPSKDSVPSTPVHQRGSNASTAPSTPSTSRRQALYERVRQKSLNSSPTKGSMTDTSSKLTRDQMLKMSQDEMRRRCLLGRLGGIAESVWMLFSIPVSGSTTPTTRKRRVLPTSEVVTAVIKSSPVPISTTEANESLGMLIKLCPFFLKSLNISGEDWLEMPASNPTPGVEVSPSKRGHIIPPSPNRRADTAEELLTRSPKKVKKEMGGLREVREIIRREQELQD